VGKVTGIDGSRREIDTDFVGDVVETSRKGYVVTRFKGSVKYYELDKCYEGAPMLATKSMRLLLAGTLGGGISIVVLASQVNSQVQAKRAAAPRVIVGGDTFSQRERALVYIDSFATQKRIIFSSVFILHDRKWMVHVKKNGNAVGVKLKGLSEPCEVVVEFRT